MRFSPLVYHMVAAYVHIPNVQLIAKAVGLNWHTIDRIIKAYQQGVDPSSLKFTQRTLDKIEKAVTDTSSDFWRLLYSHRITIPYQTATAELFGRKAGWGLVFRRTGDSTVRRVNEGKTMAKFFDMMLHDWDKRKKLIKDEINKRKRMEHGRLEGMRLLSIYSP